MVIKRDNTIVCLFRNDAKKPTALEIHDFIFYKLRLTEQEVVTIQLELTKHRFYVKVSESASFKINANTEKNEGLYDFEHQEGKMSAVKVMEANGLGVRWVRVLYLPDEIDNDDIRKTLSEYGEVRLIRDKVWSDQYRFKVKNGNRNVKIELKKHVPSYIDVCGFQAAVIYDDQPRTCAICSAENHFRSDCPNRKIPTMGSSYAGATAGNRKKIAGKRPETAEGTNTEGEEEEERHRARDEAEEATSGGLTGETEKQKEEERIIATEDSRGNEKTVKLCTKDPNKDEEGGEEEQLESIRMEEEGEEKGPEEEKTGSEPEEREAEEEGSAVSEAKLVDEPGEAEGAEPYTCVGK